jgi:hypothetical protein
LSKSRRADLREFGFFGPNRELTNFSYCLSMRKFVCFRGSEQIGSHCSGPSSRPAGLRVHTLPAAKRYDSGGSLGCQPPPTKSDGVCGCELTNYFTMP